MRRRQNIRHQIIRIRLLAADTQHRSITHLMVHQATRHPRITIQRLAVVTQALLIPRRMAHPAILIRLLEADTVRRVTRRLLTPIRLQAQDIRTRRPVIIRQPTVLQLTVRLHMARQLMGHPHMVHLNIRVRLTVPHHTARRSTIALRMVPQSTRPHRMELLQAEQEEWQAQELGLAIFGASSRVCLDRSCVIRLGCETGFQIR